MRYYYRYCFGLDWLQDPEQTYCVRNNRGNVKCMGIGGFGGGDVRLSVALVPSSPVFR